MINHSTLGDIEPAPSYKSNVAASSNEQPAWLPDHCLGTWNVWDFVNQFPHHQHPHHRAASMSV
jgi:hypothetical protein